MPRAHELCSEYFPPPLLSLPQLFRALADWESHLACWASSGYTAAGCQALETQLRTCMDTPVSLLFSLHSSVQKPMEERWGWDQERIGYVLI